MWLHLFWGTVLLPWALGIPPVSRYCGFLEYRDLKRQCCRRCLERFGPPNCPDYEFTRHCGLSDRGDHLEFPFAPCPPGLCNRDWAEQCRPCVDHPQTPSQTPAAQQKRSRNSCPEEPVPPRSQCHRENVTIPVKSSTSFPDPGPTSAPPTHLRPWVPKQFVAGSTAWYVLGITALLVGGLLISAALQTLLRKAENQKAAEAGEACKLFPLQEGSVPPSLAHQPLSRLLDELEVLEELIVLLDPEPGPLGGSAWGTTRHLAARYGLPASWATFAYSLRPAHSPLRALLETVTARDPAAQLGQLANHLSQLGRGDALGVLHKLG